jgi:hypothetical protein
MFVAIYLMNRYIKNSTKKVNAMHDSINEDTEAITALPRKVVRPYVECLLNDTAKFTVTPWETPPARHESLPPGVHALYLKYQRIQAVMGDMDINFTTITPWEYDSSYLCIGTDSIHTFILLKSCKEKIYVLDDTETADTDSENWPSIYHMILMTARNLYDIELPEEDV